MSEQLSILITCAGGLLAAKVLPYIRNAYPNCIIIGTDLNDDISPAEKYDFLYQVPMANDPSYVERIRDIVRNHSVQLVIPWSDGEVQSLMEHKNGFLELGCSLSLPSDEAYKIMQDKGETYKFLQEHNIPGPDFKIVTSHNELETALLDMLKSHESVVIKPCISRGGRDVFVIGNNLDQSHYNENRISAMPASEFLNNNLKDISFEHTNWLVMERMVAPAYDVDVLYWQGTVHATIPRLRHNPEGLPYKGYTIEKNDTLNTITAQAARALNTSYIYDLDIMMGTDGQYKVMEINPRPSGSIFCAHKAGYPLFCDLINLHISNEAPIRQVTENFEIKAPF